MGDTWNTLMASLAGLWATAPSLPPVVDPDRAWQWEKLIWHVAQVIIYVLLGLGMFALGYLIIDKVTPFSFGKEIQDKQNVAMGVVLGSVFIGIALILAAAIRG
jgi:hypothetical protein